MKRLLPLALVLLLSGCTPKYNPQAEHERVLLAQSGGLAMRQDDQLSIALNSGEKILFTNTGTCKGFDTCDVYVYEGLLAEKQFFLVQQSHGEGGSFWIISRKSGKRYEAAHPPTQSPDGRFLVYASLSELGSHPLDGVHLWEVRQGELIKRFTRFPKGYENFSIELWQDNKTVLLNKFAQVDKNVCPNQFANIQVKLLRQAEGWSLKNGKMKCAN